MNQQKNRKKKKKQKNEKKNSNGQNTLVFRQNTIEQLLIAFQLRKCYFVFLQKYAAYARHSARLIQHTPRERDLYAQRREQTTCRHVTQFVCVWARPKSDSSKSNSRKPKLYITRQEEKVAIIATIVVVVAIAVVVCLSRSSIYFVCLQRDWRTTWLLTKIFTFLIWINLFKPPFVHNNNNSTWTFSRYTHTIWIFRAPHSLCSMFTFFSLLDLAFRYWQPFWCV